MIFLPQGSGFRTLFVLGGGEFALSKKKFLVGFLGGGGGGGGG